MNKENKSFIYYFSMFLVLFGVVIIVILLIIFLTKNGKIDTNLLINSDKFGHFGDIVGGLVGSLWALSGVLLFFLALRLQTKEFKLQRKELKETRLIFSEQSRLIKIEQFENRLFNLLQLLESSINNSKISIFIDDKYVNIIGRSIFEELSFDIAQKYFEKADQKNSIEDKYTIFNQVYSEIYYTHMAFIEHYVNQITQLLKLIINYGIKKDSTDLNYIDYIISHLSKYELLLLTYHGIFKEHSMIVDYVKEYKINKSLLMDMDYNKNNTDYIPDIIDIEIILDTYDIVVP